MINNYKRNSKGNKDKFDIAKDALGAKYMQFNINVRSIYFLENAICIVEVPGVEHVRTEVKEVKEKELKNLEDYESFKLVEDVGQECIGSGYVIMQKEKHDRQKTQFKVNLW